MKHLNIRVHGRVQGVFFRDSARRQAEKLGLVGLARNEPSGTVYIEVEGKDSVLEDFVRWCHQGSDFAQVDHVETETGEVSGFSGFRVS